MANKQQGTYPLVTTLTSNARVLAFDNNQTVEIKPPDLATVLGAGGGGGAGAPVNTTLPTIVGTVQVGQTLSVTNGVWTNNPASYSYQWKSNATNVGANSNNYLLQSSDQGHTITCVVTATNASGSVSATTAGTVNVAAAGGAVPANTVLPAITGTAQVGSVLTCSTGTWSNSPTSYSYQWKSGATNVGTAVNTYTPVGGDSGNTITCTVTATNANGSASATSAATAVITVAGITFDTTPAVVPANITFSNGNMTAARLTGSDTDGVVRATRGYNASKRYFEFYTGQGWHRETAWGLGLATVDINSRPGANFNDSIVIQKNGVFLNGINIASITPPTFQAGVTLCVAVDLDAKLIWFRVSSGLWNENASADPGNNIGGISFATINAGLLYPIIDVVSVNDMVTMHVDVGTTFQAVPAGFNMWGLPVGTPPTNITLPVITGTAQVNLTLSVSNGTWNNTPSSYDYQWKVNNVNKGTNAPTYKLVVGDVGFLVTCTVTASNTGGSNAVTSASVGPVGAAPPAPVNTVAPAITGTAQEDGLLTCSTGTWTNSPASYAYQWQCPIGTNVGTNQNTYTPVTADIGNTVRCTVTATNGGGSGSANSNTTSAVTAATPTAPVKTFDAQILGTPQVGIPLFVSQGAWEQKNKNKPTSYSYQWKVAGVNAGANTYIYTPVSGDATKAVTCVVTATNATGSTTSTTAATANVAAAITAPAHTMDFQTSPTTATMATAGYTFSRSTTATYFDINGVLQTAAVNVARYQYTENGLHGLLKEEASTNFCYPSKPNTTGGRWVATGGNTITPNAVAGPDNATTASNLHLNSGLTGSGPFYIGMSTMTYPAGQSTMTAMVKGTAGQKVYFFGQNASGGETYRILHVFSGAWERTAEFRVQNPNGAFGFATVATQGLTVDATNGLPAVNFSVADVQIEDHYIASSIIPTTNAAVTRAVDNLSITSGAPLTAMKTASTTANTGGGTFYMDLVGQRNGSEHELLSAGVAGGYGINAVVAGPNTKGSLWGVHYVADSGLGYRDNVVQKIAGRWQHSNYGTCVDGYSTGVEAYATAPVVTGSSWAIGNGYYGLIRELRVYNVALSNSDMEKITKLSPGYVMGATPAGAAKKGFTNLLFDLTPKQSDICPSYTASQTAYPLFMGLYFDSSNADINNYTDGPFGLQFMTSPAMATQYPGYNDGSGNRAKGVAKGKLPYLPGKDGFSIQFEIRISNTYWANFDACWIMPMEHNGDTNGMNWFDDTYFWGPGEGANFERWWEFDVHEGGFNLDCMNTSIVWYGDASSGGYANDTDNSLQSGGFFDRTAPLTLEGVWDADKAEVTWYINDVMVRRLNGNGYRSVIGPSNNSWDGDGVPTDIARMQNFYAIINANAQDGQGGQYTMYFKRMRAYTKPTITNKRLVAYGDSLTYGTGSTAGGWLDKLSTTLAKPAVNRGIGGEPSSTIAGRCAADCIKYDPALDIFFLEGGYNNFQNAGYVEADFAAMVAAINALGGSPKFIVMGIPSAEYASPVGFLYTGGAGRAMINTINTNLSNAYGTRFFDPGAYLIANGSTHSNTGTATDSAHLGDANDDTHGIVPSSCRSDGVHWNDKGYNLIKNGLQAKLTALGW